MEYIIDGAEDPGDKIDHDVEMELEVCTSEEAAERRCWWITALPAFPPALT